MLHHPQMDRNSTVFYVAPADPWNRWTNSGVTREIAQGLSTRGVLAGAISVLAWNRLGLNRPSHINRFVEKLRSRIRRKLGLLNRNCWGDERNGLIGRMLRQLPAGSNVLYHYITPRLDTRLPLKRFLFQDMTVRQAVDARGYGFDKLSSAEIDAAMERQRRSIFAAEGIISFSNFVADALYEDYGFPKDKVVAIGAGPIRRPTAEVNTRLERYRRRRVLFVGRDWDRKGGPLLLDAFRRVRCKLPDAELIIVSSGAPKVEEPGIKSLGFVNDQHLAELYASSAVFCMPSVCETWGLVYSEALHSGMVVVGTNDWAMRDIVIDGVTGRLAKDRSPTQLANELIATLEDASALQQMAIKSLSYARTVLDWPFVMDRLLSAILPTSVLSTRVVPLGTLFTT